MSPTDVLPEKPEIRQAFDLIWEQGRSNVGLLGLGLERDGYDSSLVSLADLLLKAGYNLKIYDPRVSDRTVDPPLKKCLVKTPEELVSVSDLFVVGEAADDYSDLLDGRDMPVVYLAHLRAQADLVSGPA